MKINKLLTDLGLEPIDFSEECSKAYAFGILEGLYDDGIISWEEYQELLQEVRAIEDPFEKKYGVKIEEVIP